MSDKELTQLEPITSEDIKSRIYTIRGVQVMLDSDLAELYQVETFNLNKAVKRNIERLFYELVALCILGHHGRNDVIQEKDGEYYLYWDNLKSDYKILIQARKDSKEYLENKDFDNDSLKKRLTASIEAD